MSIRLDYALHCSPGLDWAIRTASEAVGGQTVPFMPFGIECRADLEV